MEPDEGQHSRGQRGVRRATLVASAPVPVPCPVGSIVVYDRPWPARAKISYGAPVVFVDGQSNERLVLDGEWFEKLRGGQSKTRVPVASFRRATWQDIERRVRLFGGERERLVQVTLEFDGAPFVGFVAAAEKRPQLEDIVARMEGAREDA